MSDETMVEKMRSRFTSGNAIPVERAHITAKEYKQLTEELAGGWIKCSERMPDKADRYFVVWRSEYLDYGGRLEIAYYGVVLGSVSKSPSWWRECSHNDFGEVTHWRPLPEPPHE